MTDRHAGDIGHEIARHDHSSVKPAVRRRQHALGSHWRTSPNCAAAVSRLALAAGLAHEGAMAADVTIARRVPRGLVELLVPLRVAAGAALSRLSRRRLARTAGGCRARADGPARSARRCGAVRRRFFHRVRRARRQRERHRLADPGLFATARDARRHRHHYYGSAFSRPHALCDSACAKNACRCRNRSACGAPM